LLSVIFAVLWVKGYLWWVLGIAVFLFLASGLLTVIPPPNRRDDSEDDQMTDEDEDQEQNDIPSAPPSKPHDPR